MPEKPITETIQAKHVFSQEERNVLVDQLTAAMSSEEQIEAEFTSVKADFKSRLERVSLERDSLAHKLRDKFEMRATLAVVEFDTPDHGRKSYFRAVWDGTRHMPDDFIRDEPMTFDDKQRTLPLETPTHEELTQSFDTVQSKDVPPAGYELVSEGFSQKGDLCWNTGAAAWQEVAEPKTPFGSYPVLVRLSGTPTEHVETPLYKLDHAAATTPLGQALHAAAAGKDLPLVPVELSADFTAERCLSIFRKAAKKAGWPIAAIDLLADECKKATDPSDEEGSLRRIIETLRPHTLTPAEAAE